MFMESIQTLFDFFLHLDEYLATIIERFGTASYIILFLVIFAETGLVVFPFLPGDSLLFAAGAISSTSTLNPVLLFITLTTAAILGDSVNYWVGNFIGPKAFKADKAKFFKRSTSSELTFFTKNTEGKQL